MDTSPARSFAKVSSSAHSMSFFTVPNVLDDIPATELEQLVGGIPLTHKAHRTGTTSTIATTSGPSLRIMLAGNDWVDGDKVGLEASIIAIKVK